MTPHNRTDSVKTKLKLLSQAVAEGRRDLAMSMVESIKETLRFERHSEVEPGALHSVPDEAGSVEDLPNAWADWARGWSFVKAISLFETVGVERVGEPLTVRLGVRAEQVTDLPRELRVARVEEETGLLREVPCQVDGLVRVGQDWQCRLLLHADVPQHGQALYLIFYGNPSAELPDYVTDLRVRGEGYGLEVTNHHYVARLSEQMGQLERLTSRRQHGLELYAGGKGHGEPPTIDWAHDYVDQDGFQKLRIKNWAACPNSEVEIGPLCVRLRRWGFPHSPLHPVFTPSRIHMDQTYTFHAGLPYFFKEGRIEAIQDVDVEAMRDDEWVFSGYSFNEILWIDRAGKLREGPVPDAEAEDLWGVGFRHDVSQDAFLALWLEHQAEGLPSIGHNGSPTLHYPGHGQLWSRYPIQRARLKAGTSLQQRNAYGVFAYPEEDAASGIEALRHALLHPVEVRAVELPRRGPARASGTLARPGEAGAITALKAEIWRTLREVQDEQLYQVDANIVDLGLVYDVRLRHGTAHIVMTMPHRGRPLHDFFVTQGGGRVSEGIRERLRKLDEVRDVVVDLTWNPAWTVARLTDNGRHALGLERM